jgi:hypothetical protein
MHPRHRTSASSPAAGASWPCGGSAYREFHAASAGRNGAHEHLPSREAIGCIDHSHERPPLGQSSLFPARPIAARSARVAMRECYHMGCISASRSDERSAIAGRRHRIRAAMRDAIVSLSSPITSLPRRSSRKLRSERSRTKRPAHLGRRCGQRRNRRNGDAARIPNARRKEEADRRRGRIEGVGALVIAGRR